MNRFPFIFNILLTLMCVLSPEVIRSENCPDQQKFKVALRWVAHELYLADDNKSSRVLPVVCDNDHYIITLEDAFSFEPIRLYLLMDSAFLHFGLQDTFIVEVKSVISGETVYSYEKSGFKNDEFVPCGERKLPSARYAIHVYFDEKLSQKDLFLHNLNQNQNGVGHPSSEKKYFGWLFFLIVPVFYIGVKFWFKKTKNHNTNNESIRIGKFTFDHINMVLADHNSVIPLSHKESALLDLLYSKANQTVGREEILKKVWGDDGDYVGRTLDVFVSKLRKKIESDEKIKILNCRGVGYKLVIDSE